MRALFILFALSCSSRSDITKNDVKPTMPVSEKAKSAPELESWPAAGVCATTKTVEDKRCRRLLPQDGTAIKAALTAYISSDIAAKAHAKKDLNNAERFILEPHITRFGDKNEPQIGNYFLYLGDSNAELSAENTVSITDGERWGYYFTLEQVAAEWQVKSFGISRAWRRG